MSHLLDFWNIEWYDLRAKCWGVYSTFAHRGVSRSFHPTFRDWMKVNFHPPLHSGCSIVVVYAVWDRVVRVRFPAPRQIQKNLTPAVRFFCIFVRESKRLPALLGSEANQKSGNLYWSCNDRFPAIEPQGDS